MAGMTERLTGVAILRDGTTYSMDKGSHAELRRRMDGGGGWAYPSDKEGFMTAESGFVDRHEAALIGIASGQVPSYFKGRRLLSSDVDWNAGIKAP